MLSDIQVSDDSEALGIGGNGEFSFYELLRVRLPVIMGLAVLVIVGNMLAAVFFNGVNALYQGNGLSAGVFELSLYSFAPIGGVAVIVCCLLVEWRALGWPRSSIKRILEAKTVTCRTDIFYTILSVSNLGLVLSFFFTLGLAYYYERIILDNSLNILRDQNPLLVLLVLIVMNSLCFYAYHRLLHTKFLWELHKTHHAAQEMNIITNFRNHPLDRAFRTIFFVLPVAILGVHPVIALTYSLIAGVIVLFQHTEMSWRRPWLERYILIGADGHRLHHSQDPRFAGKNLGFIVFWDWLFGTLSREDSRQSTMGIDSDPYNVQNTGSLKTELLSVPVAAAKSFLRELRGAR